MMQVRISFRAGPADGGFANVESLDTVKLFFDTTNREVHAYPRLYETEYLYSPELSARLTSDYETVRGTYEGTVLHMQRKESDVGSTQV